MQSQVESLSTALALLRAHVAGSEGPDPVEPPPEPDLLVADFEAEAERDAAPCTVRFRDRSRGKVAAWWWNFGNGNTSRDKDPTFTYRTGGAKDATLVVTDDKGNKSTKTIKGVVKLASPPPRPDTPGSLADLPILMRSAFREEDVGRSWRNDADLILSRFVRHPGVEGWGYGIEAWQSRNNAHVGISRPGSDHPPSLAIKYPKRDGNYKQGGGVGIVLCVGHTGGAETDTGYRRAAVAWDMFVPSDFRNVNDGIGRPFKCLGMAGGLQKGFRTITPWSDGQGASAEHGWSMRWQGTGRYDSEEGTMKPIPSCTDRRADRIDSDDPQERLHYGRWQPQFRRELVRRGAWNSFLIVTKGNSPDKHDGSVHYFVNGVEIWGEDDVQFRPYGGLAHTLWIGTFFGGRPEEDRPTAPRRPSSCTSRTSCSQAPGTDQRDRGTPRVGSCSRTFAQLADRRGLKGRRCAGAVRGGQVRSPSAAAPGRPSSLALQLVRGSFRRSCSPIASSMKSGKCSSGTPSGFLMNGPG
jgi:PKD repeat protein